MQRLIWDMDPGIDDALALILALESPEVEVLGITAVAGNAPVELTSANARRVLEYLGAGDIPVARGAEKPLSHPLVDARDFHGADGLGECGLPPPTTPLHSQPAPAFLARLILENPGELVLLATGPLTNLALAFKYRPELPQFLKGLVIMGGVYGLTPYARGNQTPFAEFNIWEDPEAAQLVFDQPVSLTAVGLDVTQDPSTWLRREHLKILRSGPPAAQLAARIATHAIERHGCCELHDPLALATIIWPELFEFTPASVEVTTCGLERGGTHLVQREGAPKVQIARKVEGERFLQLFLSRLLGE